MAETIVSDNGTITVIFSDGTQFELPSADSWGVGPAFPNLHDYAADKVIGRSSKAITVEGVWADLLTQPAPGPLMQPGPAATGSISDTFGPGGVQHIVVSGDRVVVNLTLGASDFPGGWEHPLHPGLVIRHVFEVDGYVVIESVGIGNSDMAGPISAAVNDLLGSFFFGGPGPATLEIMAGGGLQCFPATTHVTKFLSGQRSISTLRPGDLILAFSPTAEQGRGALVPRKVTRLYRNTTTEWLCLTWDEDGAQRELFTTPGHHFLDRDGRFRRIDRMLEDARATIVLANGTLNEVRAERILYSAETAHQFEREAALVDISNGKAAKPVKVSQKGQQMKFKTTVSVLGCLYLGLMQPRESLAEVLFSEDGLSFQIETDFQAGDILCIASSEYEQLYLPPDMQCYDCEIDSQSLELLETGWQPDAFLMVRRRENTLTITKVHLPIEDYGSYHTSYLEAAYFPDRLGAMTQCVTSLPATATCHDVNGRCLFLFSPDASNGLNE